jgi:hypothetical protein
VDTPISQWPLAPLWWTSTTVDRPAASAHGGPPHGADRDGRVRARVRRRDGGRQGVSRAYVEEAWRIVDPVLNAGTPLYEQEPGSWEPDEVNERALPPGGWQSPIVAGES